MTVRNEVRASAGAPASFLKQGADRDMKTVALTLPRGAQVKLTESAGERNLAMPESSAERLLEEMRIVKRRLLKMSKADNRLRGNIIMVGSALPGDGKSFIAYNLAKSLSTDQDHEVVLIDGDFKKPQLTHSFGLEEEPGFLNVLSGDVDLMDVTHPTENPRLTFIPAGQGNESANEWLASGGAQALIDTYFSKASGKIVVFDSAPVLRASETQVLAHLVGQVVLVIRAGSTPKKAFTQALEVLGGIENCALILNDADVVPLSRYSAGSYGYGYGYGYGKK